MNEQSILVADSDPKNLQILKENLEEGEFRVSTVTNGLQAWEVIKKSPPTLILSEVNLPGMSGLQLLEKLQGDESTAQIPLIFLTNRRELQDRVRSLKMGAKDYLVKPLHVKEVIAHIKMVLARLDRRRSEDNNSYFKIVGKLEELSIIELIESLGVERKTGILTITNGQKKSGQIFFKDGCVINAIQGDFRKEKAIFQMLSWSEGTFAMIFKDVTIPDEIAASNLGLLLHGLNRLEKREKFLQQLPAPETAFLPTLVFKRLLEKRTLSKELLKFVTLFDGLRSIHQIIDQSAFDELRTLELIVRLFKQGFIKPVRESVAGVEAASLPEPELIEVQLPVTPEIGMGQPPEESLPVVTAVPPTILPEPQPIALKHLPPIEKTDTVPETPALEVPAAAPAYTPVELDQEIVKSVIFKKAAPQKPLLSPSVKGRVEVKTGVFFMLGDPAPPKESVFQILLNHRFQTRNFNGAGIGEIKLGKIKLNENYHLTLISLPINGKFNILLDKYIAKLTGYTLIVDCLKADNWEYQGYLARLLQERFQIPFFIIALNLATSELNSTEVVRDRLGLDQQIAIFPCDHLTKANIEKIFIQNIPDWPTNASVQRVSVDLEEITI